MNRKRLEEIADVNMGSSPDSNFVNEDFNGYPFLQGCAEFGSKNPKPKFYTPRPSKISKAGDILISVRAPVGALNNSDRIYCIGRGVGAISAKVGIADSEYLHYKLIESRRKLEKLSQGSTFDAINSGDLKGLEVFIHDYPVQRKIAYILSTVDRQIEKTEQLIRKYEMVKEGMMQDLFTRGIDVKTGKLRPTYDEAPGMYKESALGWIPKEWTVRSISELASVRGRVGWKGYTVSDLRDYGAIVLGASHIDKHQRIDLSSPVYLSKEKYLESPEIMVKVNDLVVVQRGSIGKFALIKKEYGDVTINPSMVILRFSSIRSDFVYYQLQSHNSMKAILDSVSSTGVPMISQKQIGTLKILVPPDKEITSLISIIQSLDSRMENESLLRLALQSLKAGLMQDLLTEKIIVSE